MKQKLAFLTVAAMIVAVIVLRISQSGYEWRKVIVGGKTVSALIADTPEKRSKGLGGRRSLGTDEGMLFVFDEAAQYGFWMKDMKFAIDIIWINDGKIVDIAPNVQPPSSPDDELTSYLPRLPADAVLEVAAGFVQKSGVKIGDAVGVGKVDKK
ncbi:hypothetical protein A3F28_00065 [Candidatus Uhrbacteria bacterium RIFCSPHIGHO2_12_FULL_57_11]|uniref:DUF192 domain-containing protein n=1 Tax=Candidatus Uhrbacteria bacterium RIFCSPHIGHO2_12_FULL_57_11 TaxID=1802398 RepID=A0A1F7UN74_9BACT|nr:MAG: hypothetical protein A3F28_00065 [Candidatus Uhrbacteria bacterium RIFCSPHIGHO2_12_FULL_57_11]